MSAVTDREAPDAPARRRRGKGMPSEEMHRNFPSLKALAQPSGQSSRDAWVAVFNGRPDAMASLLADLIKQVHARPRRIGQRPMPREEEVDFQALIYGEDNDLPLTEVLPKIMNCGERTLAARIPSMSRSQIHRVLTGEYVPDVQELRYIAAAVGKSPLYFIEYRKAMVVSAVINLLDERPNIATTLYRRYLEVRINKEPN